MTKRILTATALAALLAMPAFAQQPAPKPDTAAQPPAAAPTSDGAGFVQKQDPAQWRGSKLIGTSVYGSDNKSIGSIADLIVDGSGQIKAAVIGVGGLLGVGQKDVAVPFNALHVMRKANSSAIEKITVTYTQDQLKSAPKFAYYEVSPPQTTGAAGGGLNSLNKGSAGAPRPMGAPK